MVEVEFKSGAVPVEALVLGVVEGGVPFEECDDPGMIIVGQGGGEFAGLIGVSEFA